MELTFVEDSAVGKRVGRKEKYPWSKVIPLVKANPGKWALLPFTITSPPCAYKQGEKNEIDVSVSRKGANEYEVFMRYTPKK